MAANMEKKGSSRRKRRSSSAGGQTPPAPGGARSESTRRRGDKGKERRFPTPQPPRPKTPYEIVQAAFFACPRCSYFLAGYRARHGLENLEAAAAGSDNSWLDLTWNQETQGLLQESLGGQVEAGLFHYSISCPECRRVFLYHQEEGGEATFQVEVQPRGH